MRRAAHQIYDAAPLVFSDPIAVPILGAEYLPEIERTRFELHKPHSVALRAHMIVRSRYAEARAGAFGQYAVLGAGLDTYAFRAPEGKRVFEADHPATQEWKKGLLDAAGIPVPGNAALVPVDFEEPDGPVRKLAAAGFDTARPALVSWLGVSYFLTPDAVAGTLAEIGRLAPGTELVMDYALPPGLRDAEGDAYERAVLRFLDKLAKAAANDLGERASKDLDKAPRRRAA